MMASTKTFANLCGSKGRSSTSVPCCIAAVALGATFVLDTSDVLIALIGAFLYWLIQHTGRLADAPLYSKSAAKTLYHESEQQSSKREHCQPKQYCKPVAPCDKVPAPVRQVKDEHHTTSAAPVAPVKLSASHWNAQVEELVSQIEATPQTKDMASSLVRIIRGALQPHLPEAHIAAFVTANPLSAKAFGVAVPEVEVNVEISLEVLKRRVPNGQHISEKQVQKAALRLCTDTLVSSTELKFRRSSFQCDEPKVIFLAPATLDIATDAFGVSFSINVLTPARAEALIEECSKLEPRAQDLILLVRRWARDRAINHAAKGNLSPYAWTLLAIYFLQVGVENEGPLLPVMTVKDGALKRRKRVTNDIVDKKSSGRLFKEFIDFYADGFDWRAECVSVRLASRTERRPLQAMPLIEDPFEPAVNAADCLTPGGLERLFDEFARAKQMCEPMESASLESLLAIWTPPDAAEPKESPTEAKCLTEDNWRSSSCRAGNQTSKVACPVRSSISPPVARPGSLSAEMPASLRPGGALRPGSLSAEMPTSLRPGGALGRPSTLSR